MTVPSRSSRATAMVRASRMLWAEGVGVAIPECRCGCMALIVGVSKSPGLRVKALSLAPTHPHSSGSGSTRRNGRGDSALLGDGRHGQHKAVAGRLLLVRSPHDHRRVLQVVFLLRPSGSSAVGFGIVMG